MVCVTHLDLMMCKSLLSKRFYYNKAEFIRPTETLALSFVLSVCLYLYLSVCVSVVVSKHNVCLCVAVIPGVAAVCWTEP